MNLWEAKQVWGYSIKLIRELCQYTFIPGAIKNPIWIIPDDAEKPPVTVNSFIVLMESIKEFREGGRPNVYRKGLPKEKIKDALYYLSGYGFIAGYDETLDGLECVKQASLLPKANEIIRRYRTKNNLPISEDRVGMNVGGEKVNVFAEHRVSY